MSRYKPETLVDKIFEGGIIIKGLSALAEFLSGLLLVFLTPEHLKNLVSFLTQRELKEDQNSTWVHLILNSANHLSSGSRIFLIIYLWTHALVKLIAVIGILSNKLWAYPFSLITIGAMILYQIYSIIVNPGLGMVLLTVFDIFIVVLIWIEYQKAKQRLPKTSEQD